MTRILIPGATIIVVVMSLVGLSGWNRSSTPTYAIELTERELSLPFGIEQPVRDGMTITLSLNYEARYEPLDARNWLPEDRLRALGFNLATPAGAPEAADRYRRTPPRLGWVALEYDGPAYQAIARRRELEREKDHNVWRGRLEPSRLVLVDAAPEFELLAARYPTGHVIARAVIALTYLGPSDRGPLIYGMVREIVPSRLAVPRRWREVLMNLPPRPSTNADGPHAAVPPRYTVELAGGPLGVPYVRSVRVP